MIILEIKGKRWVKALCKLLDSYAVAERKRFILASFNLKDLREVQRLYPRLKYLYLYHNVPIGLNLLLARKQEAWGIGIGVNYFSRLMVMASRNLQLTTVAYTVNSKKKAKLLQKMGVDYIITDYPDRFAILDA
jgi:glycerophosphoryl diester phosphodiesterase